MAFVQTPCTSNNCTVQLPLSEHLVLQQTGIPPSLYFGYLVALNLIVPLLGLSLATTLIWRKPVDRMAIYLAVFLGTCTPNVTMISQLIAQQHPELATVLRLFYFSAYGFWPLFALFPDGRFVPAWSKWLVLFQLGIGLSDWFFPALFTQGAVFSSLTIIWDIAYGLVTLGFQVYRYRYIANTVQRQQMKWVLLGLLLFVLLAFQPLWQPASFRSSWLGLAVSQTIPVLFFSVFIGSFWVAIFSYQLFDIDIILNRTLVYGLLTAFVVGFYILTIGGISTLFQLQGNLLVSLLVTGFIAILFQPIRDKLQRAANRLMYGDRDEPYQLITRLAQRLEFSIVPGAALPLTVETIAQALRLPYVAIALKQDGNNQTVAAFGTLQDRLTRFPLTYAGETIGELSAAVRKGEDVFSPADHLLLGDLARHIGSTAQAALIAIDLERARIRNVEASEETRRRLGSDLHDGVGHQLAGLTRQAERASNLLDHDLGAARDLLNEIKSELSVTSVAVRQLAHQLYPPELELLGLVGALQERAEAISGPGLTVRLELPQPLPPLPTAIESTAYYIALEALTNVSKHAEAHACNIRIVVKEEKGNVQPPILEIEISDDGRGLSPGVATGMGWLTMQARAAEVGGVCIVDANPGGGTWVTVRLPCHC